MIRLLGEISLTLALMLAFLQSVLPLCGYARKNPYLLACARPCALAQFFFVACAYILLTIAFAISDFSIAYVAANSHPLLPLLYRLTAVWGAHEGSILLWILVLNIWTLIFSILYAHRPDPFFPLTIATLGLISFCFLCFLLFTSNPFAPAQLGQTGFDLNPLLQDPGFVIHPPMLYTGYVGFSAAFAITIAALIRAQLDSEWAQMTRRFAIAAWCFLTLGITLGSWWAYRVLGWGGFWFWDPVENASLLPWLAGTALIHVLLLAERRDLVKAWAALLAIITFALSLLGTFLVRSGVLVSAHTFANDPARGVFLLLLLALLITAALILYCTRISQFSSNHISPFSVLSREMGLLLNSSLLFVAMLTVLLGTLYPLLLDALHAGAISVGAPYFNTVMTPLAFIALIFMGFVPLCHWQTQPKKSLWPSLCRNFVLSLLAAIFLLRFFVHSSDYMALMSLSLSFWVILSVINSLRFLPGMSFAHLGFAVLIIGIMLSSILSEEREVRIKPGDAISLGPYQFYFLDTQGVQGANYRGIRADFEIRKNKRHIIMMHPEKRIYTIREMVMTKVDIHPGIFRDLYIALGEPLGTEHWSVRIYYKPFMRWIWFGGIIMIFGGILAIIQKRDNLGKRS